MRVLGLLTLSCLLVSRAALGQTGPSDTLRTYRLGEVTVVAERDSTIKPVTTEQKLELHTIATSDAGNVAEIARLLPATRIQTNSRGEALLYTRGSGERQIGIFLDGALLNVPWDNRIDLSLVPISAIASATIVKGVPSLLYGTNVTGGVVNFHSDEKVTPGGITDAAVIAGSQGYWNAELSHIGRSDQLNYLLSASRTQRDGIPLPADMPVLLHQSDPSRRTNTDLEVSNAFGRLEYEMSEYVAAGVSVNYTVGAKGVAPEGHTSDARFWRYPRWDDLLLTLIADAALDTARLWNVRGALWWSTFGQDIQSFSSDHYDTIASTESDDDRTIGTRVVIERDLPGGTLDFSMNGLLSTHTQIDAAREGSVLVERPEAVYRQQIASFGLEWRQSVSQPLQIVVAAGYDLMSTPLTADKPNAGGFSAPGATIGARYNLSHGIDIRAAAGRKSRFPTMRELYGESLKRFLLNPELKPEIANILEAAIELDRQWGAGSVVLFYTQNRNTIDQRNVDTLGRQRRQRINLFGSFAYGAESSFDIRNWHPFNLSGHLTVLRTRGRIEHSDSTFLLAEEPGVMGLLTAEYRFQFGLTPTVEVQHIGSAYSPNDDNEFVELPAATLVHGRLAYRTFVGASSVELFVRANNVFNAVHYPQLGLPAAGREILAGVKASI